MLIIVASVSYTHLDVYKRQINGGRQMSRYTGPQWKLSRRLGFSTLENGKELNKRAYAPGQHGQKKMCIRDSNRTLIDLCFTSNNCFG